MHVITNNGKQQKESSSKSFRNCFVCRSMFVRVHLQNINTFVNFPPLYVILLKSTTLLINVENYNQEHSSTFRNIRDDCGIRQ